MFDTLPRRAAPCVESPAFLIWQVYLLRATLRRAGRLWPRRHVRRRRLQRGRVWAPAWRSHLDALADQHAAALRWRRGRILLLGRRAARLVLPPHRTDLLRAHAHGRTGRAHLPCTSPRPPISPASPLNLPAISPGGRADSLGVALRSAARHLLRAPRPRVPRRALNYSLLITTCSAPARTSASSWVKVVG